MIIRPIITILSFARQIILIVASWLILPWRRPFGPRIVKKTLEQHVWAYTEWTEGASWGQLLSWGYWSLADGGGSEELSRSRERWHSSDCTTRLWEQNVIYTRAWHKWHLTWIACRTTGRGSNWEHVGSHWRKATNRQIRGRNHKPLLWVIFSGKVEPKWNNVVLGRLTRKHFQVGSEEWNDVLLTRQRIQLDHWFSIRTKHCG